MKNKTVEKIPYFGGKGGNGTYQNIINYFPPHRVYIEPFLGVGTIMRSKRKAQINLGIELNTATIDKVNWHELSGITVINDCGISFLENHVSRSSIDELIYLDPPYPLKSRKSDKKVYKYELTDNDHVHLIKIILSMRSQIAISTYDNEIYRDMLKDWNLITFKSQTRSGTAIEHLYMNYEAPIALHDYSFLGDNFIERQRIKRKIARHVNRLIELPDLERQAIIEKILQLQHS